MEIPIIQPPKAVSHEGDQLVVISRPKVFPHQTGYQIAKRIMDVTLCLMILPLAIPLMLIVALVICFDSDGPILFVQERIGKGGRRFRMYKFRTMRHNFDDSYHRAFLKAFVQGKIGPDPSLEGRPDSISTSLGEDVSQADPGTSWAEKEAKDALKVGHQTKLTADRNTRVFKPIQAEQVTRVGRILRKTSLDEWPQIINVLRGEMSWVGPRPNVPWEVEEYRLWHHERLEVLPGITGLAQVRGRSGLTFDCIVKYDVEYLEKRSLALDIKILWWTFITVFCGTGAE
jgi:lipopolysaccharide/colanic/teichoic acid biosynthesis glycosyltransferase